MISLGTQKILDYPESNEFYTLFYQNMNVCKKVHVFLLFMKLTF